MNEIDVYLQEDLGKEGDITSDALFSNEKAKAVIIAKEKCIVAGIEEIKNVFEKTGAFTKTLVKDGDLVKEKTIVAEIEGPARSILKGERLALNIIGRMSGIATETKKLVDICKKINPNIKIAATRKTTPGFSKYEKKAVIIGGGEPHRYGLYDAVLIKDNHLKLIGSVEKAIKKIKENVKNKIIEIEVENEKDALLAAKLETDVIMLDNFSPKSAEIVAKKIKKINSKILIEISGGINPENITKYAGFADRISLGYLTHSIKNKDFSLEIIKKI
ncbi:MAG: carboxylating nicotinate-nucleotide diphosphorylase [Candidatus Thermoplasmatota archaeon]|jgi:nicotinate-nucleotide pyrophosphorylase (carboxylating)|nr:carboxylating nicotinate-nucleotide diphosphorylase [Candidatus Thermoplasmatota archaeon]